MTHNNTHNAHTLCNSIEKKAVHSRYYGRYHIVVSREDHDIMGSDDTSSSSSSSSSSLLHDVMGSATAGIISRILTHPLDTVSDAL